MIRAVIFDMDGVIADTQRIHAACESKILSSYGIEISPENITARYAGYPAASMFEDISRRFNVPLDIVRLNEEKWQEVLKRTEHDLVPIPGALELIQSLKESGCKIAVASSSPFSFIRKVLDRFEVRQLFDVITSGQEVSKGKPDPEIFLLAASRLGIPPRDCLVIEDGIGGMSGAKSAGMTCMGLVEDKNERYPADLVVTTPDTIKRI